MYRNALLVLAIGALTAAGQDNPDEAIKKEWAKLVGNWKVVSIEIHGKKLPSEIFKDMQVINTFDGKYTVQVEGRTVVEATTRIDPTKTPKTLDGTFSKGGPGIGKITRGIYELKGDTLTVCFGDPDQERPTKFSSAGNTLAVYQRDFMHRLIGTWECEETTKPAEWTPKEEQDKGTVTRKWVLDGKFVEGRGHGAKKESISFLTYDSRQKTYRSWWFDSQGNALDFTGQWDEKTKIFSWKTERDGLIGTGTQRFLDDDNHVIEYFVKDKEGKVFFHSEGKFRRKK